MNFKKTLLLGAATLFMGAMSMLAASPQDEEAALLIQGFCIQNHITLHNFDMGPCPLNDDKICASLIISAGAGYTGDTNVIVNELVDIMEEFDMKLKILDEDDGNMTFIFKKGESPEAV